MSKYAEKVARRREAAAEAIDAALRPAAPERPKNTPPEPRGVLVELGPMPENCADALCAAAAALDRAAAIARSMLERTGRSVQKGEATSAALLSETTAPRLRAAATRLRRMPSGPKPPRPPDPPTF